ncbi:MAG: hypothetical protein A2V85_09120 [Chloroflexi bacterium RBG_16_72_14]|nr:MAG: hypothetical protein A2V85_09120 [Chloroflexi bacterium RBG_16_72_14]
MSRPCVHADAISPVPPPASGCETCLEIGDTWVHLRQCLTCGRTLCCDDSPNRHMSRHARADGHLIMRTAEPDEDWVFCFGDDALVRETATGGWEAFDWYVEEGLEAATAHLSAGGSLDDAALATAHEELAQWVGHVRAKHATGALDAADASAIEALPGWTW